MRQKVRKRMRRPAIRARRKGARRSSPVLDERQWLLKQRSDLLRLMDGLIQDLMRRRAELGSQDESVPRELLSEAHLLSRARKEFYDLNGELDQIDNPEGESDEGF